MKISIIIITFNNYSELISTIQSCSNIPNSELVVINGGHCLQTKDLLSESSFFSISEPDFGISDAFNKGIKYSTGDYLIFLNSGDLLLDREYYERSMLFLENSHQYSFVHSDIIFNDIIASKIHMVPKRCSLGSGMPYFHQTMVMKRKIFDTIGNFNLSFKIAMDYDFVVRMNKKRMIGFYDSKSPTVLMDGTGISASNEKLSIFECLTSLRLNDSLSFLNTILITKRYLFYTARNFLKRLNLIGLLIFIKKIKNRRLKNNSKPIL